VNHPYEPPVVEVVSAADLAESIGEACCQSLLPSDARLKTAVAAIERPLEKCLRLRGVTFAWGPEAAKHARRPGRSQIGFLAQEVEAVLPECVDTDATGTKRVAYADLTALLVEAVREQQRTVEALRVRLERAEARLEER
jgi:hypothetical protein